MKDSSAVAAIKDEEINAVSVLKQEVHLSQMSGK
jgi:hypothetical protein